MASLEEKLIKLVRENSCLYRKSERDYKNKFKVWKKISAKIGIPEEKLKGRWKSLRNTYRIELNKIQQTTASGSEALAKSRWKYFDLLNFLNGHIGSMKTLRNCQPLPLEVELHGETAQSSFELESSKGQALLSSTTLDDSTASGIGATEDISGEIPPALHLGSDLSAHRKKTFSGKDAGSSTSVDGQYSKFWYEAYKILSSSEQSHTELFMHSMAKKIDQSDLTDNEIDEMQEAVLIVINKNLRIFRDRKK